MRVMNSLCLFIAEEVHATFSLGLSCNIIILFNLQMENFVQNVSD